MHNSDSVFYAAAGMEQQSSARILNILYIFFVYLLLAPSWRETDYSYGCSISTSKLLAPQQVFYFTHTPTTGGTRVLQGRLPPPPVAYSWGRGGANFQLHIMCFISHTLRQSGNPHPLLLEAYSGGGITRSVFRRGQTLGTAPVLYHTHSDNQGERGILHSLPSGVY